VSKREKCKPTEKSVFWCREGHDEPLQLMERRTTFEYEDMKWDAEADCYTGVLAFPFPTIKWHIMGWECGVADPVFIGPEVFPPTEES